MYLPKGGKHLQPCKPQSPNQNTPRPQLSFGLLALLDGRLSGCCVASAHIPKLVGLGQRDLTGPNKVKGAGLRGHRIGDWALQKGFKVSGSTEVFKGFGSTEAFKRTLWSSPSVVSLFVWP